MINHSNIIIINTTIPNNNTSLKRMNNIINNFSNYNIPILLNDYILKNKSINDISFEMIINSINLFKKINFDYAIICDNDFFPINNFLEEINKTVILLPENWRCLHLCPGYLWGRKYNDISKIGHLNPEYNMDGIDYHESGRFYNNCDSVKYNKNKFWLGGPIAILVNKNNVDILLNDFIHEYNNNNNPNDVIFTKILKPVDFICREPILGYEKEEGNSTFLLKNQVIKNSYISGYSFYKISQWCICPRYNGTFSSIEVKLNDFVFLNLDYFDLFVTHLNNNPPKNKFNLITHNSDIRFSDNHYHLIKDYVFRIYSINNTCNNINVKSIPIGFRDYPNDTVSIIQNIPVMNKDEKIHILYMNFIIKTNIQKRSECYNTFHYLDWVINEENIEIQKFYINMSKSKYILSPEGTGIDCHRIYESLYLNSIPIIKCTNTEMDKFYNDLPIVIVSEWNLITKDFLIENYDTHYSKMIEWKKKNDWLNPLYWLNK